MQGIRAIMDSQFKKINFINSEMEHRYGKNYHIQSDPYLLTKLAMLSSKETMQPMINLIVAELYKQLIIHVINNEFPRKKSAVKTRMIDYHQEAVFTGELLDHDVRVVTVSLARAGILPSQITFDTLNHFLNTQGVRQDHISISRQVNKNDQVIGASFSEAKIGGSIHDAILLFPDPMGATGGTLSTVIDLYKKKVDGKAIKFIAMNLIVTPEFLKRMKNTHPDLIVYALRLDRGLSKKEILNSIPGTHWNEEKGLNEKQYIVPGAGGLGEILNNAYV